MDAFDYVVMLLQLSVVFLGFPSQIARNYGANECGETSLKLILVFATFSTRFINTGLDHVWYVFIPDFFAVMFIGITLWQLKSPRNVFARRVNAGWQTGSEVFHAIRITLYEFRHGGM